MVQGRMFLLRLQWVASVPLLALWLLSYAGSFSCCIVRCWLFFSLGFLGLFLFHFGLYMLFSCLISLYESRTKRWPTNVATSPAVPGRPIGRTDGPDRAIIGHFSKKSPRTLSKSTRSPSPSLSFIYRKVLKLYQNKPAIHIFKWVGLPSALWAGLPSAWAVGRNQPVSLFSFYTALTFLFKSELFQNSYKITKKS
jgi:hypothetical protein